MWIIIVTTLISCFLFLVLYFLKLKSFQLKIPNAFPSFFGLFYTVWKLGITSPEKRFEIITNLCFDFPDMFKVWLGPKLIVFINNPEKIQKVLMSKKCLEKWTFFYSLLERDYGLIAARNERKWKKHRKFFNFSFGYQIVESFTSLFVDHSEILCESLEKEVGNQIEFDFLEYSKKAAFGILCATNLGTNMKKSDNAKYYKAFET
jgi:cytochrome P450